MKIGQLIKYNMRNTFLEKSYVECCGETIPRPFKKSKLRKFLDQQSKVLYSLVFLYAKLRTIDLKLSCRPLAFTSYKAFSRKNNKNLWLQVSATKLLEYYSNSIKMQNLNQFQQDIGMLSYSVKFIKKINLLSLYH